MKDVQETVHPSVITRQNGQQKTTNFRGNLLKSKLMLQVEVTFLFVIRVFSYLFVSLRQENVTFTLPGPVLT